MKDDVTSSVSHDSQTETVYDQIKQFRTGLHQDTYIRNVQQETHEWRMEEWPDVTALAQTFGTAIEVMELGELVLKGEYYDEEWADEDRLEEEAGDALVYLLGVMSLLDLDVVDCIESALDKNDARDWDEHQKAPTNND